MSYECPKVQTQLDEIRVGSDDGWHWAKIKDGPPLFTPRPPAKPVVWVRDQGMFFMRCDKDGVFTSKPSEQVFGTLDHWRKSFLDHDVRVWEPPKVVILTHYYAGHALYTILHDGHHCLCEPSGKLILSETGNPIWWKVD